MTDDRADAELLAAATRGDNTAFAVLVRRYIRAATMLATQIVGEPDDAEDVVQDAFTVVLNKGHTFDVSRPFAPWFFAIVRRLAANRRARELRRSRLLRLWHWSVPQRAASPDDISSDASLDSDAVKRAIGSLSPMQRACFELVKLRGFAIAEVALLHGISESTVRQHVFRARAVLREVLSDTDSASDHA